MAQVALAADDLDAFLRAQGERPLLRFITCGSVDDGKSTLIGRLLYESKRLFDDQLATLEAESRRHGTQQGGLDFALLVDGLAAEREQGITIDVAYRFFGTERRKFIVADTPGHEQYTRNMATGASTCDLAIILIDARKGVLTQTRRHSAIVAMLGVRHVVLAVNKMDLVGYAELAFARIERDYRRFAERLGFAEITAIPLSALKGDNVVERSGAMPWYRGPALLEHLDSVEVERDASALPFRLPVQWVSRPHPEFRGYAGLAVSGRLFVGDRVRIEPSGRETKLSRIVTRAGELGSVVAGQSVTLVLADEIDVARGELITSAAETAAVGRRLETRLLWLSETPLEPGRSYLLKAGTRSVNAVPETPDALIDIQTLERRPGATLGLNALGIVTLTLDRPVAFDPYERNRETGAFILIDRASNETAAMGFIDRALDGVPQRAGPLQAASAPRFRLGRGFARAASWWALGTLVTIALVYGFTGEVGTAFALGAAELASKALLYAVHERAWAGLRQPPRPVKPLAEDPPERARVSAG
jgi:sulfate adenylyltransferase large subunit